MIALVVFVLLLAGVVLGSVFYAGLWLTVRNLPTARHPVWLTLSSFWLRTLVVIAGFLFVMKGRWQNALICLAGFVMGRIAVSRFLVPARARTKCP